jgi:ADP-heptose:LPS heptosyltransferase
MIDGQLVKQRSRDNGSMGLNPLFQTSATILVCMRYGIGDVVMQTPALEALWRAAPGAHIVALGATPAVELLAQDPAVDEIVDVKRMWGLTHWYDAGEGRMEAIQQWLAERRFDMILDASHAVLAVRQAIWEYAEAPLFNGSAASEAAALRQGLSGVEAIKRGIAHGWGLPVASEAPPRLHLSDADRERADRWIAAHGCTDSLLLGISVEASSQIKQWPAHQFAAVADFCIAQYGAIVLLFAAPQDPQAPECLAALQHREQVRLVQTADLHLVAGLLSRCAAFTGNDTGLMHIAAAMGVPVAAVFGPTWPGIYLPMHSEARAFGGWTQACAYRHTAVFGAPQCVHEDRCLAYQQSCIHEASPDAIRRYLEALLRVAGQERRPDAISS